MGFVVIKPFRDSQDNHVYAVGDVFPHDDRSVSKKRIEKLSTDKNKAGYPVIEKVEEHEE